MLMKRLYFAIMLFVAFAMVSEAQTYLMDNFKPSEGRGYTSFAKSVDINGGLDWKGGFVLQDEGYVKFKLNAEYESIRFVLGHRRNWNSWGDTIFDKSPNVVTVWADDVKVYDGIVRYDGIPEQITARINGAKELTFRMVQGPGVIAFGEVTLWKAGQTPRQLTNLVTGPAKTMELVKDMKPYLTEGIFPVGVGVKRAFNELKTVKVNGMEYGYGLLADMSQALIGDNPGKANFWLRRQYSKMSFIVGPVDGTSHGEGWVIIKADNKIIYELEMKYDDTAKQVVLDIDGCDMLSIQTEQQEGNMNGGIVKIMVYPEGAEVAQEMTGGSEAAAPADPRLKTLPDVTKLVSQVKPYAIGSDLSKQIYDGASDYVTFSMGGTKYSEGFILYERANLMDDNIVSYAVFDLGNEFDHVRFTAGFVGKSWTLQDDYLFVYADDELILSEPLDATSHPKEYILPINKCRKLRFENHGQGQFHGTSAYGIADVVVYRGDDTSVNPFVHPKPAFPHEIDLIDLGKPYLHFVSQYENAQDLIFHDGSTKREYFNLNGQRIYKGFALKTSISFSLDMGPLSNGTNAAAAGIAGGIAAGAAFVPIASVGNAMIGSTLSGAAGLLLLAAGGTAVNNSCAAFNLYGEYNSVTFTVACEQRNDEKLPSDYTETLMIGVNGEVVQTMTVYETMEPTTVTIPVEGCQQLMFWLANTSEDWSGKYIFYDVKVTKDRLPLNIPRTARLSEAVVTQMTWDTPEKMDVKWVKPDRSGDKYLDEYLTDVAIKYNAVNKQMRLSVIDYEVHTWFLETNAGQACKAVRLMPVGGGKGAMMNPAKRVFQIYQDAVEDLEGIRKLRREVTDLNMMKANAALGLPSLGFRAIEYGKYFKAAGEMVKYYADILKFMERQKTYEVEYLARIVNNAVDIDSRQTTEQTVFCPVFADDVVPEGDRMLVDVFYMPENVK